MLDHFVCEIWLLQKSMYEFAHFYCPKYLELSMVNIMNTVKILWQYSMTHTTSNKAKFHVWFALINQPHVTSSTEDVDIEGNVRIFVPIRQNRITVKCRLTNPPPSCHIYASMNGVSIGSDNGLSPIRRQAII